MTKICMNNLLENLNQEQLKAVLRKNGPLLIVAGAGTGKTTVIAQRIAYLIEQGLAESDEVLALTFTEKAAGEMSERVESLLPIGYFDLWISTFHGFAERILKEHGLAIGLPTDFKLLNEFEQWAMVKKNLDKFNLDYYRPMGNPAKFIHALIKHFSRAKDEDMSPRVYLEYAEGLKQDLDQSLSGVNKLSDSQEVFRINEVANAYHVYQQLLLDNNSLDFGDLINYSLKLFRERPAILEKYRKQFKYILVDEFQDTNCAQYELVKILAAPADNLTVVGDDDQAIFRFRGASMSNILQFRKDYPKSEEIVLTRNYRNRQNILDLAYEFIKHNNPDRLECRLEKRKLNKKLMAENSGGGKIEVLRGADLDEEVSLIADKICELKSQNKSDSWNDFAVLVRANDSANDFMAEFDRRGLPYIFGASRGLYAKPAVMDAIAFFKLLDNYHESASVWRFLNLPVFNFSQHELMEFNHVAAKKAMSLYEVLNSAGIFKFSPELQKKIEKILSLIAKYSAMAREKRASEIFLDFMNYSGYCKYLSLLDERKKIESFGLLNQFLNRIKTFENSSDDKTVKAFLLELNMEMESGEQGKIESDLEAGPEAIKILTAHGSKGLEFQYVFIPNLVDKRFPTIERSEQIKLPDALVKEILPEGDAHLQEERRLFYVAMTRAKYGLYFSWASDYGGKAKKKPSRFLYETGMVEKIVPLNNMNKGMVKLNMEKIEIPPAPFDKGGLTIVPLNKGDKGGLTIAPSHFSYSQLAAYSTCPYQYYFAHILKIPTMGKEQFSFGKTLHSVLQKLFALLNEKKSLEQADLFGSADSCHCEPRICGAKQSQIKIHECSDEPEIASSLPLLAKTVFNAKISFDEILKLYEKSWIDDWYESKERKLERKKQGLEILKEFYAKHKHGWPEALFLEKAFNLKISDGEDLCVVRGSIDRIDKCGDGLKLVDYKTGKPKGKLGFEDKEQLFIYQLAAEELFKQEVKSLAFYYLESNSEVEFSGSAKDLEKIKNKIISTVRLIKQNEFSPSPSRLCDWCDFNRICEHRA
ncbi:MAG: UvrD-helicase domain-containing protein [bacterium]